MLNNDPALVPAPGPLDVPEAWELLEHSDAKPRTWAHPAWRECGGRFSHYVVEDDELEVFVGGDGSAPTPWLLEVSASNRWPTLEELRAPMLAFCTPGASFIFLAPFLTAVPFTEIPPVLMVQVTAVAGTEAERRLVLSGGLQYQGPGNVGNERKRSGR